MHRTIKMAFNVLALGEKDVRKCLSMKECLEINRNAFILLTTPNAVVPTRLALPFPNPASIQDWTLFKPGAVYFDAENYNVNDSNHDHKSTMMGMKLVSVRANNPPLYPLVPATLLLVDASTGMMEGIMSATYLTAARTATGPALATYLCRPDAQHLVLFGAGLQAETHLEALILTLPNLAHVTIINRTKERAEQLIVNHIESSSSALTTTALCLADTKAVHAALETADVICTTTNTLEPLFKDGHHVKAKCHINSIGSYTPHMTEIPHDLVRRSTVIIDTIDAMKVGDLNHLPPSHPHCFLGHVLQDKTWLDDNKMEFTFFKGVGTAIQDIMTGAMVMERAKELGLGTTLDMT